MTRACTWTGIRMNTLTDKSTPHMAGLLIQGNTMGMTAIIRNMREQDDADIGATSLAEKLLATAEHNVSEMKNLL